MPEQIFCEKSYFAISQEKIPVRFGIVSNHLHSEFLVADFEKKASLTLDSFIQVFLVHLESIINDSILCQVFCVAFSPATTKRTARISPIFHYHF